MSESCFHHWTLIILLNHLQIFDFDTPWIYNTFDDQNYEKFQVLRHFYIDIRCFMVFVGQTGLENEVQDFIYNGHQMIITMNIGSDNSHTLSSW